MYSTAELVTLTGKTAGGISVHPIVEIRSVGGLAGGMVQVVPVALILEAQGELSTFLMENIKTSDEQSAG